MRVSTNDRLTTTALQKTYRTNSIALITTLLLVLISLYWLIFHSHTGGLQTDDQLSAIFKSVSYLLAVCIGAGWAFRTAYHFHHGPVQSSRARMAWVCIGCGLLANGFGALLCMALKHPADPNIVVALNTPQVFSYIFLLLFYPCLFLGLMVIPGIGHIRLSKIFDVLIITLCFLAICWFLVSQLESITNIQGQLIPTTLPLSQVFIALAAPMGDIFLLLFLALVLQQGIDLALRLPFLLLALSFMGLLWSDVVNTYLSIFQTASFPDTTLMEPFYLISFLLLGLSGLFHYSRLMRNLYRERMTTPNLTGTYWHDAHLPAPGILSYNRRRMHTLYVPLAIILCVLLLIETLQEGSAFHPSANNETKTFIVLSIFVAALIAIRYFFAMRENETLLQERDRRFTETERARHLVAQLTDIRDLESLRERIVNTVLSEYGFSSAMLLLIEDHTRELTSQSHLLVSTSALSTHPTKWRLRGDTILYQTVKLGKQTIVYWQQHIPETPAEVRIWQEKQHVALMEFFPIRYQGKILGSLGVARHELSSIQHSEEAVIRVYTEQIAAIIEHAYLYQEARRREDFARAIANISKRLIATIVEPGEVGQLICEEGIRALHAEYAIFYLKHDDERLEPMAIATKSNDTMEPMTLSTTNSYQSALRLKEWPSFSLSDYEAEAQDTLHPFLLYVQPRRKTEESHGNTIGNGSPREPQGNQATLRARLSKHSIQRAICAPLVAGGELIGILIFARSVQSDESNNLSFEDSDLSSAQVFAEQVSVIFANSQLYQRIHDTHERLKELDQLKDQFMITASHELRTPLTAVQGYIELMAQYDSILPAEQRQEFLQKAQLGCEELAVLLRNIMDASRLEAEAGIKPALISRVSVKEMIEKVQIMIEPQVAHEHREIRVQVPAHLLVFADPLRLHQVLMNVSTNALKYSPPGSPLTFSGRITFDQRSLIIISISDKGKGISVQDQEKLFQRFVRLESDMNSPVRGSGLGLYISRRLIEAMGGKIWIESKGIVGEGSTFHIQLPMA
ncbi:sensor histidine kinase [Tengunoibacter tsumagoiensis]|uniref:histidine kinase n=1 Tax=Tengunoibacter tsumagoiensis TaxID=2014871 RepID=A0A402A443_9CHLR|nr:GAF domain-containing sensor histidine kinase [Tengunoibacter tsumagoiensis]GCE13890.1 hypothetical protein KTT_37490 [Tengunoibacter tsumagoiensis]